MKTIQINVVLNNVPQKLSFSKIDEMAKGNSAFKKFYCCCSRGMLRGENDVAIFAQNFISTYHPNYETKTFKLILEMGCAKLVELVKSK